MSFQMFTPVLRVSDAREIFRLWLWAYTGVRSNLRADRPTPPTRVLLMKILREKQSMMAVPQARATLLDRLYVSPEE